MGFFLAKLQDNKTYKKLTTHHDCGNRNVSEIYGTFLETFEISLFQLAFTCSKSAIEALEKGGI